MKVKEYNAKTLNAQYKIESGYVARIIFTCLSVSPSDYLKKIK
jgi:hypothetical protein